MGGFQLESKSGLYAMKGPMGDPGDGSATSTPLLAAAFLAIGNYDVDVGAVA
ncbi:MAG: hypothetical protein IPO88_32365 [Nannocystis sp.]|uniref:hypothetical protein n=1 Tax=Nannocystis sp. TaxID=1962667 RepID=UPI0024271820|nr:hypothetical protein [Nannocystis sp.]MBK9758130.1 hypothetical protein [Nannocystis sp.]